MSISLTDNEQLITSEAFTTNQALFWIKTKMSLTSKRVVGSIPNTILGLIPLGRNELTFPLKNISGVFINTKLHLLRLLVGLFFITFIFKGLSFGNFVGTIFGLILLLNSFTTKINITNNANQSSLVELSFVDKGKAKDFVEKINNTIAGLT